MYTAICLTCPDKTFIKPGTESNGNPLHADGDRGHRAVPMLINHEYSQQKMLDRALEIIRARVPEAKTVDLTTSDQGRYGFVLTGINSADGRDLLPRWDDFQQPLADLSDLVGDQISDLNWDGVVGEGRSGYVTLNVQTGAVVSSS